VLVIVVVLGSLVRKAIEDKGGRRARYGEDAGFFLIVLLVVVALALRGAKAIEETGRRDTTRTRTRERGGVRKIRVAVAGQMSGPGESSTVPID
jgi:hypothetical protein